MTRPLRGAVPRDPGTLEGCPTARTARRPATRPRTTLPSSTRCAGRSPRPRGARHHEPEPARRCGGARRRRHRGGRRRHGPARRAARRGDGAARGRGPGPRRYGGRHPGAVRAPRPHAAVHRGAARAGWRRSCSRCATRIPTAGGGAEVLRAAGVAVARVCWPRRCARGPLRAWLHAVRTGRPHVTWKFAATLDGRIAAADGTSRWITGAPPARRCTSSAPRRRDRGRHRHGARRRPGADRPPTPTARRASTQPLRVVVGHRRRPPGFALDAPDVLHLRTHDPDAVLAALHARGVVDVLLEGGPRLAGAFVAARRVDRVLAYIAPALLGAGPAALGDAGVGTMAGSPGCRWTRCAGSVTTSLVDARPEAVTSGRPAGRGDTARAELRAPADTLREGAGGVHRNRRGDRRGRRRRRTDEVLALTVRGRPSSSDARHGDSIAVNGVCLTVR